MKKPLPHLLFPGIVGMLVLAGCAENSHRFWAREPATLAYPEGELVITEEPPAPRRETIGLAPDPSHVWVEGYWAYSNRKWVWIPGHWELPPHPKAVWVEAHWVKNSSGRGWTWVPGEWN
jgi:WXXGXW repeat (2 copies)